MAVEPPADPDKVANKSFATGFRGYDQGEVRAYLTSLSAELRRIRAEQDELLLRLSVVEQRSRTAEELDTKQLTMLVGEETARVLETARHSAQEMRTKAEQSANRMLHEADEEATAAREAANRYATETREQADQAARTLRSDAEAYASGLRTTAEEEAFRAQSDAESYALEVRAEADEARTRTLADADAYAAELRQETDADVERQRAESAADAEALRADAAADADRMRSEAADALGERTAEAEEVAAGIRADAEDIRHQAVEDAAAELERAREEGEQLLAEARAGRDEVTKEIARRRRQSRQQLEQVSAARERLLEAYATVRSLADDATRELKIALPEARAAAEAVVRDDPDDEPEPAAAPVAAEIGPDIDTTDVQAGAEPNPDPVETGTSSSEDYASDDQPDPPEDRDSRADAETETDPGPEDSTEAPNDSTGEAAPPAAAEPDVDALFARLRAGREQAEPVDPPPATEPPAADLDLTAPVEPAANGHQGNGNGQQAADPEVAGDVDADEQATLLEQRDDAIEEAEMTLTRRLKRALSDEQNDLLDKVRRAKAPSFDALLGDEEAHRAPYLEVARDGLADAADAGHRFFTTTDPGAGNGTTIVVRTAVDDLAEELADDLVRQLRARVERCFSESDDEFEVTDRVRACYREWKSQRIAEAARHAAFAAFNRGLYDAAPAGAHLCWVVDNGGTPCPDADDNALAGALPKGEPFPTGHTYPPAHPGCRCLAVPVTEPTGT